MGGPGIERHTIREILSLSTEYLQKHGVTNPRKEAEWLLAEAMGVKRLDLYLRLDQQAAEQQKTQMRDYVRKRAARMPRAYVIGYAVFMGLKIDVNEQVLVPRPETEILVETARGLFPQDASIRAADIGTGAGAVAAALLDFFPNASVLATDLSSGVLGVARANLEKLAFMDRTELIEADLLPDGPADLDLIAANLPYVREGDYDGLEPEVKREPKEALVSGPTGLEIIHRLIDLAPSRLKPAGWLVLEMGHDHAEEVKNRLAERGFTDIRTEDDFGGVERVAAGRMSA